MAELPIANAVRMMENFTLVVKIEKVTEFRIRVWIAVKFIELAALIMNCDVRIDSE